MPPFRPVDAAAAGPGAVGILVPPGRRTVIVVRPRSLAFDLLVLRRGGPGFLEGDRTEAAIEAEKLRQALAACAVDDSGRIELVPDAVVGGFLIRLELGSFALLACQRATGQAYQALRFATQEEATRAANLLETLLCPPAEANQEIYVNTQHFERSPSGLG